jgi:hypothetical protein
MEATTNGERIISTNPTTEDRLALTEKRLAEQVSLVESIYRNIVRSVTEATENGALDTDEARRLLTEALIPEKFWATLGTVEVEVEVRMSANVHLTHYVTVRVPKGYGDDDVVGALEDEGMDVQNVMTDGVWDLTFCDEEWEVEDVQEC